MKQYLYRHFNADGELLYVGITNNLGKRIKDHSKLSAWFEDIGNITVEKFDTREEVLERERQAIISEKAKYNIQHQPKVIPVMAEAEPEPPIEVSRQQLLRNITFQPCYEVGEISRLLGLGHGNAAQHLIDGGELGCIKIKNPRSRLGRMKILVTGWQLVDYLEYKGKEYE